MVKSHPSFMVQLKLISVTKSQIFIVYYVPGIVLDAGDHCELKGRAPDPMNLTS